MVIGGHAVSGLPLRIGASDYRPVPVGHEICVASSAHANQALRRLVKLFTGTASAAISAERRGVVHMTSLAAEPCNPLAPVQYAFALGACVD